MQNDQCREARAVASKMPKWAISSHRCRLALAACIDALLPAHCILCGLYCYQGRLCSPCAGDLPAVESPCRLCALPGMSSEVMLCGNCLVSAPPWDGALAALIYDYPVDRLVHRFKFRRNLICGQALADEMLAMPGLSAAPRPDVLVPVPLHFTRRFMRGFNQAEFLARSLGRQLGIPVGADRLRRTRRTPAQSGLDKKARQKNIRGAFSGQRLRGLRIALIDDVMTTGTTLAECTRAARLAGAKSVTVWVAARVPADGSQVS